MIEFITASHRTDVLKNNLLKSDILEKYPLSVQHNYENVPRAYNSAKTEGITIYIHHDVFLPFTFEEDLLNGLKQVPDDWGVIGVAGVKLINNARQIYGYIMDRNKTWGAPVKEPIEVDTLDEMLLITRGDIKFDEQFEQDFYGADICMQAREQGRKCYVIKGFCDHNSSRKVGQRTDSFYVSQVRFKEKWKAYLPIATTCSLIQ